ncbi:MAG: hypothetical protein COV59_00470 [Candidatus Magasanikbacteria bacterium CG11_big_fil_rev_8_21_14_0_20_39_34]|uniref:Leucine-binding protein domain-containing protein n=1 Tax=Candidatus Magasanikbacteria bacterium CG11_big_fil_rev_8_21_14_0_20_39_34 TaxID=1974653 RepID=A0A2H0N8X0_9BACT|nr:MAG: hypothetical protein COV59_00470 [Candidatus Magasanikbacteria bacterium CG11_big_fil_rev_8_21_14_0_20_39_34]
MKKIIYPFIFLLAILVFPGCAKEEVDTQQILKVGAILSLTGNGASYGVPAKDAITLALDEFEALNPHKKVEVFFEDSQFDPQTALSALQSLQARDVKYFVSNGSSVSVALKGPVVQKDDFLIEVGAVTPLYKDGEKNTCRLALTADVSGQKVGQFISNKLHAKNIAFLTLNDEYGTAMYHNIKKQLDASGVDTKIAQTLGKDDGDFRTQITKIIAQQDFLDAVVVIPTAGQAERVFKQLQELGWKKPIISDNWTIINQNLHDRSLVEGVYFSNYDWSTDETEADNILQKQFKKNFQEHFHYAPPVIAGNAYDAMWRILDGWNRGKNVPEQLATFIIESKNAEGVTGKLLFDEDCESKRDVRIDQVIDENFEKIY